MPGIGVWLSESDMRQLADDLLGIEYATGIDGRVMQPEQHRRLWDYVRFFGGEEDTYPGEWHKLWPDGPLPQEVSDRAANGVRKSS